MTVFVTLNCSVIPVSVPSDAGIAGAGVSRSITYNHKVSGR